MRTPLLTALAVIGVFVTAASSHGRGGPATPPDSGPAAPLVTDGNGPELPPRPGIVRARVVTLDADLLATLRPGQTVRVEPFADAAATVVIDRVGRRPDRTVVSGTTLDCPGGSLLLVQRGGATSAELRLPGRGVFRVRGDAAGFVAQELDDCGAAGCGTGPDQQVITPAGGGGGAGACDDGTVVDAIILYSSVARQAAGGAALIEADIAMSVEATNDAYVNSQIGLSVNPVLVQEVDYGEPGSYADHLYRLTDGSDGILDQAHALRDQYGADLVCLFVDDGEYCGIAWLMSDVSPTFEEYGFSIVTWYCSSLVLGHEFGHNMGCHHDHDNASSSPAFAYSYGHRFDGNGGTESRTVMSYAPGTRIPHFSNPGVPFDGQPTGVPGTGPDAADNALTIEQTRATVASFRCSVPPIGPCCIDASCSVLSEEDCIATGGAFYGIGAGCDPDPCTAVTGACCNGTACSILTEFDCLAGGGEYLGDGAACDGAACVTPGDDCAGAFAISGLGTFAFDTSAATTDGPDHPACAGFVFGDDQVHRDVWFDWTSSCTGVLTVTTCEQLGGSATFDTRLAVYEGWACPATDARLIDCNDDDPDNACGTGSGGWRSTVAASVVAGASYKIRVGGYSSSSADSGTGMLMLACTCPFCPNGVPADTNADGVVDVDDLLNVLLDWGMDGAAHGGDVDGNGVVDVEDLLMVLLAMR